MDDLIKTWMDKSWAVVGFDRERASEIIADIESECGKAVIRKIQNKLELRTEFEDGTVLRWISANNESRGNRFGRMWCDKTINKEFLNRVVLPCYRGKRENIIWL